MESFYKSLVLEAPSLRKNGALLISKKGELELYIRDEEVGRWTLGTKPDFKYFNADILAKFFIPKETIGNTLAPYIGFITNISIGDYSAFVFKTKQYNSIHQVKESSINGIAHPFNGTLIDRSTISIAGLPDAYLFYNGAETEYLNRITEKFNIPAKTITQSVNFHPPVISYNKEWDLKLNGSMYFMLRNQYQANVSKYKHKPIAMMFYLGFIYSFILINQ